MHDVSLDVALLHQARAHGFNVVQVERPVAERDARGGQDRVQGERGRPFFWKGGAVRGDEEAAGKRTKGGAVSSVGLGRRVFAGRKMTYVLRIRLRQQMTSSFSLRRR